MKYSISFQKIAWSMILLLCVFSCLIQSSTKTKKEVLVSHSYTVTFVSDAEIQTMLNKQNASKNYELWRFAATIHEGIYISLCPDNRYFENGIVESEPVAFLYGQGSAPNGRLANKEYSQVISYNENGEEKAGMTFLDFIERLKTYNYQSHHPFVIRLGSLESHILFITECVDQRSKKNEINSQPNQRSDNESDQFTEDTIRKLIPFVEKYLLPNAQKIQSEIPVTTNQDVLSKSAIQPEEKPLDQQQPVDPKEEPDNSAPLLSPNAKQTSIPVYKTNRQGSSLNHKSTPSMVSPVNCSGVFYEEENVIILEQKHTNSLIVICSEEAVSTESNMQTLRQMVAAKNNKSIRYIITATPMGRCISLLFEEGSQRSSFNINSKHLVNMSHSSEQGSNFCFAVNSFKVIESSKPSYIKRMKPILKNFAELAGIGLTVYICLLLYNSIKSKLYS